MARHTGVRRSTKPCGATPQKEQSHALLVLLLLLFLPLGLPLARQQFVSARLGLLTNREPGDLGVSEARARRHALSRFHAVRASC